MIKNLRNKAKNKKGFTLVELIVVVVIILVLGAVLIPNVLKYIEKANQANCKADASSILVQLQVDAADFYTKDTTGGTFKPSETEKVGSATYVANKAKEDPGSGKYSCTVSTDADTKGEITAFSYGNDRYYTTWSKAGGWTGPTNRSKN